MKYFAKVVFFLFDFIVNFCPLKVPLIWKHKEDKFLCKILYMYTIMEYRTGFLLMLYVFSKRNKKGSKNLQ